MWHTSACGRASNSGQELCTRAPTGTAAARSEAFRALIPQMETSRLILRAPNTSDFAAWKGIFADDHQGHLGGPLTTEGAWASFSGYVAGWLLHGHGLFAVDRKDTGSLVGFVHVGIEFDDMEPELGWLFIKPGRGYGFATEAAAAAKQFALDTLGANAFVSYIDPRNERSIRVAQRLGAARDLKAERSIDDNVHVWRHGV